MLRSDRFDSERAAREKRRRAIALAVVLAGLVLLFYVMTMVRVNP
jgi:high-affinity K+ transport system ATPase subunit B